MIIENDTILLRSWQSYDAKELYELAKSPSIGPAAGWNIHRDVNHSLEFITKFWSNPYDFAIVDIKTNTLIGGISLMVGFKSLLSLPDNEAEIGYWIGEPYWNKGYATKATNLLMDFAFNQLGLNKLWCGYYDGNEASKRVQEKCGFKYQYTIHDMPCYVDGYPDMVIEHVTAVTRFNRPV